MSNRKVTFLTNHAAVTLYVLGHPRITIRKISHRLDITERAVVRILKDLRDAGCISAIREGRRNRYLVNKHRVLEYLKVDDFSIESLLPGASPPGCSDSMSGGDQDQSQEREGVIGAHDSAGTVVGGPTPSWVPLRAEA